MNAFRSFEKERKWEHAGASFKSTILTTTSTKIELLAEDSLM